MDGANPWVYNMKGCTCMGFIHPPSVWFSKNPDTTLESPREAFRFGYCNQGIEWARYNYSFENSRDRSNTDLSVLLSIKQGSRPFAKMIVLVLYCRSIS